MKHFLLNRIVPAILLTCTLLASAFAEGSKDFIDYPGERLFFHAQVPQQLKVYAAEGEFLNFGASHVGITGGFITVYRPNGSVYKVYDNTGDTEGLAIINNHIEERAGPTGGGNLNAEGYKPGVIQVAPGEEGIWSITLEFPSYNIQTFINLENDAPWNRAQHQPLIQRVITAWDITVSQNAAANNGGNMLEGRVYTNEYGAIVNLVSATTSPMFYILSKDGIQYEVIFGEVNPWGFQINSSSIGVLNGRGNPHYKSAYENQISRVTNLDNLDPSKLYVYEPQAEDKYGQVNNKVFFNKPSPDMPNKANVTDIFRNNTHETWLYNPVNELAVDFEYIRFSPVQGGPSFLPEGSMDVDLGAYVIFDLNRTVSAQVLLDLNFDGDYDDEIDRALYGVIGPGIDTLFWDARDGLGDKMIAQDEPVDLDFKFIAGQGEIHVALADIEENPGGIIFRRINGADAPTEGIIYNHIPVGGGYSGGTLPYELAPTTEPFTYADFFGNQKYLDYYAFERLPFLDLSVELLFVNYAYLIEDTDGDGIADSDDRDDDNDGIPDHREYCFDGGAACLPEGLSPWGDNDEDGVKNYLDNDDPTINYPCEEYEDGVCLRTRSMYDYDGDGRPNHLDSDSDNDGILDVVEAGHGALDLDKDGEIDGDSIDFGANGFYNDIATDPDALNADLNYTLLDTDGDEVYNFLDLDSDNDGIPGVIENLLYSTDSDMDGRLDVKNLLANLEESFRGIPVSVHPALHNVVPNASPDFDNDGIPNHLDLDSDNDGIHDVAEGSHPDADDDAIYGTGMPDVESNGVPVIINRVLLSPTGENSQFSFAQYDFDGDLLPNMLDLDADNDGMHDVLEANFSDGDGDGFIGFGIGTPGGNGITIADAILVPMQSTSFPADWDKDNFPDYKDLDSDNDGIHDVIENGFEDSNSDGFAGSQLLVTSMGQVREEDQTVLVSSVYVDKDNDGVADFRDRDSDNDGIHDVAEARLSDPDNDGIVNLGLPLLDEYGRAFSTTSSPGDQDNDGILNFRDLDADNDGLLDAFESGGTDGDADGIAGSGVVSVDAFGVPFADMSTNITSTSNPLDSDNDGLPDFLSIDSDGDGIPDVIEADLSDPDMDGYLGIGTPIVDDNGIAGDPNAAPPVLVAATAVDSDGDGLEDFRDPDSDNDNLPDAYECPSLACRDLDQDGLADYRDPDRDGDGLGDLFECGGNSTCADIDGDGLVNADDLDSDDDGLSDALECPDSMNCPDIDNTNVVDVYEFTCHSANIPQLAMETENTIYCHGTEVVLMADVVASTSEKVSYTWTRPDGSELVEVSDTSEALVYTIPAVEDADAGIYTLHTQSQNGCISSSININVQVIDAPNAAVLTAVSKELCSGGFIEIDADLPAMNGLSYEWYFDDGSGAVLTQTTLAPTLIISEIGTEHSGSYSLIVRGPNCESPVSNIEFISVKPVLDSISISNQSSEDLPICGGGSLGLFADPVVGAEYLWSGPNGFTSTDQNPVLENITSAQSGDYSYILEIPGCQVLTSSITTVYILEIGSKPVIEGPEEACIGGAVRLTVGNEYNVGTSVVLYEWYALPTGNLVGTTDVPELVIDNVQEGMPTTYYVEVTLGECTTEPSDFFDIEIQDASNEVAYISEEIISVCEANEITVTASEPTDATGSWSTSSDAVIITPDNSSTIVTSLGEESFYLVWSLSNGTCEDFSRDSILVEFPESIVAHEDQFTAERNGVVDDYDLLANDTLPVSMNLSIGILTPPEHGVASVSPEGLLTYAPTSEYIGTDKLIYEVCFDGCFEQCDTARVLISVQPASCKIPNIMTPNNDGMNDTFIVPCIDQHPDNEVIIFNRWGDKVYSAKQYQNDWDGSYRGNELPPGTYFYLFKSETLGTVDLSGFITLVR